jgi:hypothetical protein
LNQNQRTHSKTHTENTHHTDNQQPDLSFIFKIVVEPILQGEIKMKVIHIKSYNNEDSLPYIHMQTEKDNAHTFNNELQKNNNANFESQ